ncbi:MAG: methyltransferase domain-containing protein [Acidobacteria bacterium]|nr:methyltransferase domain-containing protein [Acidobacteriota bacterium]MCA1650849.1 methyltransferase domain-containing protein [Acidobacteriota bacterium]
MTTRFVASIALALLTMAPASHAFRLQLGSRPAEDWIARLERPERVASLKTAEVIEKLRLKPGDVVADLGAGAGVFSWPLARTVTSGKVYAVEVDKGFIAHLERRAKEQQITNVQPVLGKYDDPLIPEKIDLAFFHDVLHHIDHRDEYLKKVASYLEPTGRIAVIELDAERPGSSHADDPKLQVTRAQLQGWMEAAGLEKQDEINGLFEDKWFVIYGKPVEKK